MTWPGAGRQAVGVKSSGGLQVGVAGSRTVAELASMDDLLTRRQRVDEGQIEADI